MAEMNMDFKKMINQVIDLGIINSLSSFPGPEEDTRMIKNVLELFYKYGVRPIDAINLILELTDIFQSEPEEPGTVHFVNPMLDKLFQEFKKNNEEKEND